MYKDKIILVTGGASGIGRLMVKKLLVKGGIVVLWDISETNIEITKQECEGLGTLHVYNVDISDPLAIKNTAKEVLQEVGVVDVLINNAGIVVGGKFVDNSERDIEKVMAVNALAPMYVTKEFLPAMLEKGSGNICNISSSASFVPNPNMTVYVASKWATFGWSDSLRVELKHTGVKVTTILPYYINTGMFDGVKSLIPLLKPDMVASVVLKSIEKGVKVRSIRRWLYRTARILQAILPVSIMDFVMDELLGIYHTMDNFVGRK